MSYVKKIHDLHIVRTCSQDFARVAAESFLGALKDCDTPSPLVTLPTGHTPLGMYEELRTHHANNKALWNRIRYLALDEYADLKPDDPRLFQNWLDRELLTPLSINQDRRTGFRSDAADPEAETRRIEIWLDQNGPIDIAVLGLGTNGHIGFNEPGAVFNHVANLIALSSETRQANAAYWSGLDHVPEKAYTLGLKPILDARKIFLLVSGAHKSAILDKVMNGPITQDIPASMLRTVPNVTVIADKDALEITHG